MRASQLSIRVGRSRRWVLANAARLGGSWVDAPNGQGGYWEFSIVAIEMANQIKRRRRMDCVLMIVGRILKPHEVLDTVKTPIDCGHKHRKGAKFCGECGAEIGREIETVTLKPSMAPYVVGWVDGNPWQAQPLELKIGKLNVFSRRSNPEQVIPDTMALVIGRIITSIDMKQPQPYRLTADELREAASLVARDLSTIGLNTIAISLHAIPFSA